MFLERLGSIRLKLFVLVGSVLACVLTPVGVRAEGTLEEDLGGSGGSTTSPADNGVADMFKNHEAFTSEHLDTASVMLSPFLNAIGYVIGALVLLAFFGIFLVTALDLLYIAVPFTRGWLYKGAQDEMQGGMMGGYGAGYGAGGYGAGGYGRMGGYSGGGAQRGLKHQLISDEAVQCSMLIGAGQQGAGGGMVGGYQGIQAPQNEMSTKSIIGVYFKKRSIFIIIFAICAIVLTSSILMDTGVNLAKWVMSLIEIANSYIPN